MSSQQAYPVPDTLSGASTGATGLALLATASVDEAQSALSLIPPSPWHALGSIDGSTSEWLLVCPAGPQRHGSHVIMSTNAGTRVNIMGDALFVGSGSYTTVGNTYGHFSKQSTAATANTVVGYYVPDDTVSTFPRPFNNARSFCHWSTTQVLATTDRRMVFGMQTSTAGSAGLAGCSAGVTQSTYSGWYLVIASDAASATTVYFYSSFAGGAATAATTTGMTVAANDVLTFAIYTKFGARGATKTVGWSVYNLTQNTAVHGDFTGTPSTNAPAGTTSVFPVFVLRTLAATAIDLYTGAAEVWGQ